MLVYCDSVILMYFFDHTGPFNVGATSRLVRRPVAAVKQVIAFGPSSR